jgi:OOP family OmpA-OmpF porin
MICRWLYGLVFVSLSPKTDMKTSIPFGKLLFALSLATAITGCGSSDKKVENTGDTVAATAPSTTTPVTTDQPAATTESFKDFDWSTVPQSTAEIGAFPYLTAPEGFYIQDGDGSDESKTG